MGRNIYDIFIIKLFGLYKQLVYNKLKLKVEKRIEYELLFKEVIHKFHFLLNVFFERSEEKIAQ